MPIQHPPPARQTRSQARTQDVLTPTPRVPLDGTPAVSQLRAKLDRGPILEGAALSRKEEGLGEDGEEEEENSVEEKESEGSEGVPAPVGASQGTGGPTLAQSNQPVSHQSEPSPGRILCQLLAIDFISHRVGHVKSVSRQRQSSHVSHENVTQSPNPFQHYSQRSGSFTSLASASPILPPISVLTTPYAFTTPPLPSFHLRGALPTCLQHSLPSLCSRSDLPTCS
ncbi:hypothetical protein O181_097292 [Austropuccinia psidii MF-1]|uniref:Uncharacterized protein n=1 Tax=Austropuccinia psidii MF-1 TaxID=1389203 RepID=A0A9Q3J8B4_9BASI|nr:hypothetical protein [Austropuccinia psidii MF-1]